MQIGKIRPLILEENGGILSESLISYDDTSCFSVNRYSVKKTSRLLKNAPSVVIVTEGAGALKKGTDLYPLKRVIISSFHMLLRSCA